MNSDSRPARSLGLAFIILGSAIFLICGVVIGSDSSSRMVDFRAFYFNSRNLLQGGDPYNALKATQWAEQEGAKEKEEQIRLPNEITFLYPPSALVICSPISLLPFRVAESVWIALNGGGLVIAAFLMWQLGADYAPILSGILIGSFLATSEGLLFQGNISGIVIATCLISAWCFLRDRLPLLGVLCLAISLSIKPHDSGLVWLFFLAVSGLYRKRALQTLLVTAIICIGSIVWMQHASPHWPSELRSNIHATTAHGAANDPGPASGTKTMVNRGVDIQTVFSVLRDIPTFYASASFLLCGTLLALWFARTLRSPITSPRSWIALAFLAALSLLPVYHRHHDAKLLMLCVPGCAFLFSRKRLAGLIAVILTAISLALNADIPRAILASMAGNLTFSLQTVAGKFMTIVTARPAALAILATGIFYLWAYWKVDPDTVLNQPNDNRDRELVKQAGA